MDMIAAPFSNVLSAWVAQQDKSHSCIQKKKNVEFAADGLLGLILFLKPMVILQKVSHNNTYTFKYTT